jgi:hypothetical protein
MTPREQAKALHEEAGMSYEDACNLARYDPIGEAEVGPGGFSLDSFCRDLLGEFGRGGRMTDEAFYLAQIRGLEAEIRTLKESLRDRFAMAALAFPFPPPGKGFSPDVLASSAYLIADAMLKARQQPAVLPPSGTHS